MQNKSTAHPWLLFFFQIIPLRWQQSLAGAVAGLLAQIGQAETNRTIKRNIDIAFADLNAQQRHQIAKQATQNELRAYFEFFHIWGNSKQKNLALIHQVHGLEHLKSALAKQKGAVLIVPHFGTWEVMNAWLCQHSDLTIMYMPIKNPTMDRIVLDARQREGANLVQTDETGVKQIFKALKNGGTTVILPDHTPKNGGELVSWFDIPVESSQLSAKMIQKTGAGALLLYTLRNDQGGFDLYIEPISEQIYDRQQNGTAIIHQHIEQLIRRHPSHYHWSYKRFKASAESKKVYSLPHAESIALVRSIQAKTQQDKILHQAQKEQPPQDNTLPTQADHSKSI
ncbi:KDO2-lipid IV(A) lauroyltransferase [Acinetobacter marinus]|uniref:KDO2-lipid IV(A) lauroyltransferase n=1 Tax=Acinetobacter marinus TaxID=281375 RepID=A0A1G6KWN4_9GAMM|nr:lysophospholipid acyltransferase family protein [Acinetobacter marinus]SDC35512.1 KDO2-lipid IV(A) lauroyltransferase [Acinetobacter marinus]